MNYKRPIALTDVRFICTYFGGYDEANETNCVCLSLASKALNVDSIDLSKKDSSYFPLRCEI